MNRRITGRQIAFALMTLILPAVAAPWIRSNSEPLPIAVTETPMLYTVELPPETPAITEGQREIAPQKTPPAIRAKRLTNEAFARTIQGWHAKRRCALQAGPTDGPRTVRVEMTIGEDGHVRRFQPQLASGFRERQMVACLENAKSSLHFPKIEQVEHRTATFVF